VSPGEKVVLRNRREVIQHAAAFQHTISTFVKHDKPMSEELIKSTHEILVRGLSASEAGVISSQKFGGVYRVGNEKAFAGSYEFVKPSAIPKNMKSMVKNLQADLAEIDKTGTIDPYMLAAKYCDRFVNVHPFKDGIGRMCRMILNAILIKYAGIVVTLGERDMDWDEYLFIAAESGKVGGHPGQPGKLVLEAADGSFRRLKNTLMRQMKAAKGNA
jgi:Fic family protein